MDNEEELQRLKDDILAQMEMRVSTYIQANKTTSKVNIGDIDKAKQVIEIEADLPTELREANYRRKVYEIGRELSKEL